MINSHFLTITKASCIRIANISLQLSSSYTVITELNRLRSIIHPLLFKGAECDNIVSKMQ